MRFSALIVGISILIPSFAASQEFVPPTFSEWERLNNIWVSGVTGGGLEGRLNVWEYGTWSTNTGSVAGVATDDVSRALTGARLSIDCDYDGEAWAVRLGLNYQLDGSWYGLNLAGSGPQGRPAAIFLDGEVFDNSEIQPGSDESRSYAQRLYSAISTTSSRSIPIRFMDPTNAGEAMLSAEFSTFQRDRALLIVNELCTI